MPDTSYNNAGILYTSKETHYSVMKAARMYRMDAIEVKLSSAMVVISELQHVPRSTCTLLIESVPTMPVSRTCISLAQRLSSVSVSVEVICSSKSTHSTFL